MAILATGADLVVPSPGVPERHVSIRSALEAGVAVRSEVDLAAERIRVPLVAITGTNGKTTVTELTARMLSASGLVVAAAGNIGRPLIEVEGAGIDPRGDEPDLDVVVAEVSSFQLALTDVFRPRVAVLLAVAEDHTDWHGSFDAYVAAKARIFANQTGGDLLVYDADDPVATGMAAAAPALRTGCSLVPGPEYHLEGDALCARDDVLARTADLRRALPHDIGNSLAAAAAARHVGASPEGVLRALRGFETLPHRVTLVGESGGVRWYDDSKATNPHAALAATRSFERVVLLAGGRNKGLDLGALAQASDHVVSVVAFGEAAGEVEAAFAGIRPVTRIATMHEAVLAAAQAASAGDVVLLSPGCASFDAYDDYAERGDDFSAEVLSLIGSDRSRTP
ncbi:MAG: UDP-N-acetylmuramoyl-L-alanine--D-glutamate ligase [Acidimicrobiia bacterium]|nr:UDP-N-acetylmuramoyl-L-alanine--D-glutamate ligase [Acidimicrobiia bacterium]